MKFKKYETNYQYGKFLKEKEINGFEESFDNMENNVIIVYPEIQYQEIMGFGGALTESS
jgi:sorbitol-specific phosphotransferase system component IIC